MDENKPLAEADFETGMCFEQEVQAAYAALNAANAGYQAFVAILRRKYDAPASEWKLSDWAIGFERIIAPAPSTLIAPAASILASEAAARATAAAEIEGDDDGRPNDP